MILLLIVPFTFLLILVFSLLRARLSPAEKERRKLSEGIRLFTQKNFESAFTFFDDVIRKGEKCATAYLYRGLCHARHENLNSALYDLTTALSYDNSLTDVYLERGKIYTILSETDKAIREFERAVFYSKGKRADILRYRGLSLMEKRQYFQAARYLRKSAELGDEEANYLLMTPPFHNTFGVSKDPHDRV